MINLDYFAETIPEENYYTKEVKMITIDEFVQKFKLKIDFIKMDVEGYEYFALLGAKTILKNQRPILLIEHIEKRINALNIDKQKFKKLLEDYDLFEVKVTKEHTSLAPFDFGRPANAKDMLCLPKQMEVPVFKLPR